MSIRFVSCLFFIILSLHNCTNFQSNTIQGESVIHHDMKRLWDADISPDNQLLALAGDPGVKVIQIKDGSVIKEWNPFKKAVHSIAFSPDGKTLVAGGWDGAVRAWEMETGNELFAQNEHSGKIGKIDFSKTGERLAIMGRNWVEIWSLTNWEKIESFQFDYTGHVFDFNPDGNRFFIVGTKNQGQLWEGQLWEVQPKRLLGNIGNEFFPILSCAFSKDGKR